MMSTLVLGLILTVAILAVAAKQAWINRRCTRRGHQWQATETGFRCQRCPAKRDVGDHL